MRLKQYLLLVFTLAYSCLSIAGDRNIFFLQQEKPGHIIYVSINARSSNDVVVFVSGLGNETVKEQQFIPMEKFNEYWRIVSSSDLEPYKYLPVKDESVTGLNFYTVKILSDKREVLLRLPIDNLNDTAHRFLTEMQSYIP